MYLILIAGWLVSNITKQNFLLPEGGRANIFNSQKQITLAIQVGIFEYKTFVRLYNVLFISFTVYVFVAFSLFFF